MQSFIQGTLQIVQDIVVACIVLVACLYTGKKLFRSYRSGKCSGPGSGCAACEENQQAGCLSQSEQKRERKK